MKKQESFKKLIKKRRKYLITQSFLPSTLTMWSTGQRTPRKQQAMRLSVALNIPLKKIPYWSIEIK
jgi:hypothetical protein